MWTLFFILSVIAVLALSVHVVLEMNRLEKAVADLAETVARHYESS